MSYSFSMLKNLSPGERTIFESLQGALQKLGVTLTPDQIDALSRAILSSNVTTVSPGDRITSSLFNQLASDIINLKIEVAKLGSGQATSGPPEIISLSKGSITMGEELAILGRNLEIAHLVSVKIAGVPVDQFKSNKSNSSTLVFDVPAIIGIVDPGATVTLEIKNTFGGPATASLFVKPGVSNELYASFEFNVTPPATPIPANGSGDYTFTIDATTSRDEEYSVEPEISGDWGAVATPTTLKIPKSYPMSSRHTVTVKVSAPASGSATLKLKLSAKNFPGKTYPFPNVPVAVGSNSGGTNPDFSQIDIVGLDPSGKVVCGANKSIDIVQTIRLFHIGEYQISAEIVPATAPWTVAVTNDPNPLETLEEEKVEDVFITVTGKATVSGKATLRIIVERTAPDEDSAQFEFDITP